MLVSTARRGRRSSEAREHQRAQAPDDAATTQPLAPSVWYSPAVPGTSEPEPFPMPEIDSNGVDRSQIRRMLALTPGERLRTLESALASIMQVRSASRRAEVPRNPDSAR